MQTVDKPYGEVTEGHHDPPSGFVSTGYTGRTGRFWSKSKPFLLFFTAVSFANSEKWKFDKEAKPLCRHAEAPSIRMVMERMLFTFMKSKVVQRLMRALITVLGAGVGAALTALAFQLYVFNHPGEALPAGVLLIAYSSVCILFGLIFFFLSNPIIALCAEMGSDIEQRLDKMPVSQMMGCLIGLVIGLVIAALLSQLVSFLGASMFTTAFSAILYVTLGALGWSIGWKRGRDVIALFTSREGEEKEHRFRRRHAAKDAQEVSALPKMLDTSVLIDGRILDVCRTGFVEGELVAPQFVLDELRHIADATDPLRRARGRRGLDILQKLQAEPRVTLRVDDTDYPDTDEVDVKLLRLAKQLHGVVMTGDYNLNKVASVAGVGVLNLNELAGALKPAVLPGEEMTVQLVKVGKEPGQGVAYLDDGTMIVVEGGGAHLNETLPVTVTTALQTSAGRMIFAKLK